MFEFVLESAGIEEFVGSSSRIFEMLGASLIFVEKSRYVQHIVSTWVTTAATATTLTKVVSALNCPLELTERHQIRAFAEFPDVLQAGYAVRN